MKKLVKILLCATLILSCVFCFACTKTESEDSTPGLHYMKFKGDDYYTVYGYGAEDDVDVLDIGAIATEKNITIGRIKTGAFDGNSSLTEIIVPDTVVEIDEGAFKGMKSLKSITLPFVGGGAKADAFDSETAKSEDKIVDSARLFGYVFGTEEYDDGAKITQSYGDSDSTVTYYIPKTLHTVTISPKDNYEIPMYAFYGATNLYKVSFTDKVIAIGESAFYGCENLMTVGLKSTVKNIYANAFNGCKSLAEYTEAKTTGINLKDVSLDKIGEKAFAGTAIKNLEVSVSEIGSSAFAETSLVSVKLGNVKSIGANAFYNCKKITSLEIAFNNTDSKPSIYLSAFATTGDDGKINYNIDESTNKLTVASSDIDLSNVTIIK